MNSVAQVTKAGPSKEARAYHARRAAKAREVDAAVSEVSRGDDADESSLAATLLRALIALDSVDPVGAILSEASETLGLLVGLLGEREEGQDQRLASVLMGVQRRLELAHKLHSFSWQHPRQRQIAPDVGAAVRLIEAVRAEQDAVAAALEAGDLEKAKGSLDVAGDVLDSVEHALAEDPAEFEQEHGPSIGDAE